MKKISMILLAALPLGCTPAYAQLPNDRLEQSIINYCREAFNATRRGDMTYVQRTMPRIDADLRPVVRVTCMAYMQGGIDALTNANEEQDDATKPE